MIVENLELIFATSIWSVFIEKENTDLHEASILDLDIKIRYGSFNFTSLKYESHFHFLILEQMLAQIICHQT